MHYVVSAQDPGSHLLSVRFEVDVKDDRPLRIALPAWIPGHYVIEDFARLARAEWATDEEGRPLPCPKVDPSTWEVRPGKARRVRFGFETWAHDISVHGSYLDHDRLSLNGGPVYPYVAGRMDEPCTLHLRLPRGWKGPFTGLRRAGRPRNRFQAADYHELLDCPIMAGQDPTVRSFEVEGVPHHLVLNGRCNASVERLVADAKKIVEAAVALFGDIPYDSYHFLVDLSRDGRGGLEHRNSTHCLVRRFDFQPRQKYIDILALLAHEFFHTWNVKRLVPAEYDPYDYSRAVPSPLLWFAEGLTKYYEKILMRRAGVITTGEMLDILGAEIRRFRSTPGRHHQSVEEASCSPWVKLYKHGPHLINQSVSYYNKGCLIGFVMDMEIRTRTSNRRCLDDLLLDLYERYGEPPGKGYTTQDVEAAAQRLAGKSLARFLRKQLTSRGDLDLGRAFRAVGMRILSRETPPPGPAGFPRGDATPISYLGAGLRTTGRLLIEFVLDGTPAARAGLSPGDEILAVDRFRMNEPRFEAILAEKPPGTPLELLVDHDGEIRTHKVILGERPESRFALAPLKKASKDQQRAYFDWTCSKWSDLPKDPAAVSRRPVWWIG